MKLAGTLGEIARGKLLQTIQTIHNLSPATKRKLATYGGIAAGFGVLGTIGSWRMNRYRSEMTRDQYQKFLQSQGYVQRLYGNRRKSYMMGSNLQDSQIDRLFAPGWQSATVLLR